VRVKGVYHCVKSGETFWRIARSYNIDIQDLAEINNITDLTLIEVDGVIFIPGAERVIDIDIPVMISKPPLEQKVIPTKNTISSTKKKTPAKRDITSKKVYRTKQKTKQRTKLSFDRKRFIWPVKGKVVSRFGIQPNDMKYNGINIAAREGKPVVAAASGTVIHSSLLRYYGNTIIIKHRDSYATVYAYLKSRKVKVGDSVKKGQQIALLGKPENNSKPYLYFEIRRKNKARNPLFFLPSRK
jgi:lipoprotein NlpD